MPKRDMVTGFELESWTVRAPGGESRENSAHEHKEDQCGLIHVKDRTDKSPDKRGGGQGRCFQDSPGSFHFYYNTTGHRIPHTIFLSVPVIGWAPHKKNPHYLGRYL